MRDITDPRLLCAKGCLFLAGGVLAAALLVLEHPTTKTALLLTVTVWCFARAYYFAFYVIGRYVDPGYRFAGLTSAARHLLTAGGAAQRRGDAVGRGPEEPAAERREEGRRAG